MRKILIASVALTGLVLGGALAFTAEAAPSAGALGLVKPYSMIDKVACNFKGPLCPIGYTKVCRMWKCWCARCH